MPLQMLLLRVLFSFLPVAIYTWSTHALARKHLKYTGHFIAMSLLATVVYYDGFARGTSSLLSGVLIGSLV